MSNFNRLQFSTALLITLGMITGEAISIVMPAPAAQLSQPNQPTQVTVPVGTLIPTTHNEAKKIVLKPDETLPLTLTTTQNVTSPAGVILIPKDSQITGQLQPAEEGSQFIAKELVMGDSRRMAITATSNVITKKEEIRKGSSTNSILQGALIGAGAAVIISEIIGDIDLIEVIGGAGVGALGGWLTGRGKKTEVVVVEPKTDLNLILNSNLALR